MIWEDKSDSNRAYIVGIMSQSFGDQCQETTISSVGVNVPGDVFQWILENGGTAIKDCLV